MTTKERLFSYRESDSRVEQVTVRHVYGLDDYAMFADQYVSSGACTVVDILYVIKV